MQRGWIYGGASFEMRPSGALLRMMLFLNAIIDYLMVMRVPAKPWRVSNHARRVCKAILPDNQIVL